LLEQLGMSAVSWGGGLFVVVNVQSCTFLACPTTTESRTFAHIPESLRSSIKISDIRYFFLNLSGEGNDFTLGLYEYGTWSCQIAASLNYIQISYKAGQPVFLLMWLLYLADNHMYSVAYQHFVLVECSLDAEMTSGLPPSSPNDQHYYKYPDTSQIISMR
jgi:hypothetical protein